MSLTVGISRIRDKQHNPVDVIGGIVVATLFALVFLIKAIGLTPQIMGEEDDVV